MLTCTSRPVNATECGRLTGIIDCFQGAGDFYKGVRVADVKIEDGIISVKDLVIQDPKAAAVLMEYPEARWAEVTRRALKIGLGYLKGGAQD
jgi:hypothetical protein